MFEILQGSLKTLYKRQKVLSFCVAAVAFVVLTVSFLAVYNIRVSQKLNGEMDGLVETLAEKRIETAYFHAVNYSLTENRVSTEQEILSLEAQSQELEGSIAGLNGKLESVSGETSRVETEIAKLESRNLDTQISKIQTEIEEIRKELEQCESKHC